MTGYPLGPFAIVFFQPYLLLCCQLLCFFCSCLFSFSALRIPSLLPPRLFPAILLSCLLACPRCALMSSQEVATCEVPILRPQLEPTSKKPAAWNSAHLSVG